MVSNKTTSKKAVKVVMRHLRRKGLNPKEMKHKKEEMKKPMKTMKEKKEMKKDKKKDCM